MKYEMSTDCSQMTLGPRQHWNKQQRAPATRANVLAPRGWLVSSRRFPRCIFMRSIAMTPCRLPSSRSASRVPYPNFLFPWVRLGSGSPAWCIFMSTTCRRGPLGMRRLRQNVIFGWRLDRKGPSQMAVRIRYNVWMSAILVAEDRSLVWHKPVT